MSKCLMSLDQSYIVFYFMLLFHFHGFILPPVRVCVYVCVCSPQRADLSAAHCRSGGGLSGLVSSPLISADAGY